MAASKLAVTEFPLLPLLASRWSPRSFADKPVPNEDIGGLFEAARWSPSCFNDQPWRFILARKGTPSFQKVVDALMAINQAWAAHAPVLVVSLAQQNFRFNDQPNRFAAFDVGQSVAHLTVQAASVGLVLHQMGGYSPDAIVASFGLEDKKLSPLSVFALGYPGDGSDLSPELLEKENTERSRLALSEILFDGDIATPAKF